MRAAAVLVCAALVLSSISCDPVWQLSYDETERIRLDRATAVEIQLDVSPTLLDEIAQVRVYLLREGQAPLPVLETQGEAWGLRGGTLATRLGPGGAIGVHLGATVCALPAGGRSFECLELVDHAPQGERREALLRALEWLIGEPRAADRVRTRAAIGLASARTVARPRALRAIEAGLDVAEGAQHLSGELVELRALRRALAPTQDARRP